MRIQHSFFIFLLVGLLAGCALYRFGPGFSMNDPEYFSEPPHIVAKTDGYSLRWRYGSLGFFFLPEWKVVDGQLLFALQATSSSGSLSGKSAEVQITDPKLVHAIETGGAFWLEPDGRKVPLEITR